MSIDIREIVRKEIENEKVVLKELNELNDLDDLSKQEIRFRCYDAYRHLQRQLDLEIS